MTRASAALAGALVVALAAPPAGAAALKKQPEEAFSISGQKGPFIKQVAGRTFRPAAAAGASMGLASDAVNQGRFQSARLRMPQTEARIKAMLDRIEAQWPYPKTQPVQVHILGVDYYSAYALPDGSIMVGFGLLERAESDDEVAFVLAHELSHVRLGHFARAGSQQQQRKLASRLGQLYTVGSALRGGVQDVRSGGMGVSGFNAESEAAGKRAAATNDLLHYVNNTMVEPAWSRAQEDEADALGFDLAQLGSWSAESASARVFDTIQADAEKRQAMTEELNRQLRAELTQAAGQGAVQSLMGGGVSAGGLARGLLRSAGRVAAAAAASASDAEGGPKHRTPAARKTGIANYSADAYPDGLPLRDEQTQWLQQVRGTREYADAKVAVAATAAAMKLRAAGDYAGAEREIARAQQTAFRSAPLVLNEAARIQADKGDAQRADGLFAAAHQSPDQTVDGYLDHVRALYTASDTERAMGVVRAGVQRFRDEKPFLSLMVALARQSGDEAEAERQLARCAEQADPGLKKDCELAAGRSTSGPKIKGLPNLPFSLPRNPFN